MNAENGAGNRLAALLVIDLQVDFCPGGSLAVAGGDEIVPLVNRAVELFSRRGLPVYATRDWHPAQSGHFQGFGGPWPPHCLQDSAGARFHPGLRLPGDATIVSKGCDPRRDDYSPFQVETGAGLTFGERLRKEGVGRLYLCGLATDYCVRASALEGLGAGFRVRVLTDAVRGVNLTPGDADRALAEVEAAGGVLLKLADLEDELEREG